MQWEIYNTWETTSPTITGEPNLAKTFRWDSSAWEMAGLKIPPGPGKKLIRKRYGDCKK
jgi:hypothetical protein